LHFEKLFKVFDECAPSFHDLGHGALGVGECLEETIQTCSMDWRGRCGDVGVCELFVVLIRAID
jgi:hypothetical protein